MFTNVHETRVFECDMKKIVLTISGCVEPVEFGTNFDAHKVKKVKNPCPKDQALVFP